MTVRRRICRPKHELEPHYDVIVVGSGYGGGIAALRLAEAGARVCVLERGTERLPEDLPRGVVDAPASLQARVDTARSSRRVGNRLGLFDVRVHDGLNVLVGCGVGGTSLINASVFVMPEESLYEQGWPSEFSLDTEGRARAADRARAVLHPTSLGPEVEKMELLREIASGLDCTAKRLPLMVERAEAPARTEAVACTGCGNCISGCRVGAKHSVDATYLSDAARCGASVFSEIEVESVRKVDGRWNVYYAPVCRPITEDAPRPWISADVVVLAAGALGSTEILARSAVKGLGVSRALGSSFSANGNMMGAVESPNRHVRGTGTGEHARGEPGACITMAIEVPASASHPALHVEDGTVPTALHGLARLVGMGDRIAHAGAGEGLGRRATSLVQEVAATATEAMTNSDEKAIALLVQHDDGAKGRLELGKQGISIRWPDYGEHAAGIDAALERIASSVGGRYRPLRPKLFGHESHVSVHPLGGCAMANDRYSGVVDHRCEVFDSEHDEPDGVHEGLFVCDGAVIPRAVGRNPVATICVVAERAMALLAERWGSSFRAASRVRRVRPESPSAPNARGFALSEAFDGWLYTDFAGDPSDLVGSGGIDRRAHPASAHFSIEMQDFAGFRSDPSHAASVLGTVTSDVLGGTCAVVLGRAFLLTDDPIDAAQSYNLYQLELLRPDGRRWTLSGTKVWTNGGLRTLWESGTQMVVEVLDPEAGARRVATGLLRMSPGQFAGSVRSYEGRIRRSVAGALQTQAEFLGFSLAKLRDRFRIGR